MKFVLIFTLIGIIALVIIQIRSARAESPARASAQTLEEQIKGRFAELEAPGAVYALVEGDTPKIRLALGHAEEAKSRPITFDDHFRIGSVTKLFVGQVVLQLLDEGKLSLADKIGQYVDGVPGGDAITLRMIGNHTSGLPSAIFNREFQRAIEAQPGRAWTTREILDHALALPVANKPGEGWHYSNTNTVLLGMVIEKVTGRSWQEEVQSRLLDRLNLTGTGFPDAVTGKLPEPAPRGYRFGRRDKLIGYGDFWFDATDWSASWTGASGHMYSTLDDLARFTRALARGELVGEKGRAALFDYIDTRRDGIESGFHVMRQAGAVGGVGDVPGFSAFAAHVPERDTTVVALANLTATRAKLTAAAELGEMTVKALNR